MSTTLHTLPPPVYLLNDKKYNTIYLTNVYIPRGLTYHKIQYNATTKTLTHLYKVAQKDYMSDVIHVDEYPQGSSHERIFAEYNQINSNKWQSSQLLNVNNENDVIDVIINNINDNIKQVRGFSGNFYIVKAETDYVKREIENPDE